MGAELAPTVEPDQATETAAPELTVLEGGADPSVPTPAESEPVVTDKELERSRTLLVDAGQNDRAADERFVKNFARAYFYTSPEVEDKEQFSAALKYAELKTPTNPELTAV